MANASAKRVASQNAATIKTLRLGMLFFTALSFVLRLFFRRSALSPARFSFWIYVLSMGPSLFLVRYLEGIGSPRRDPTTGTLLWAGEDLARPGIIEWCFDLIYITWACQVGSGILGQWVWWLYLVVPGYAMFKLWSSVISPFVLGRSGSAPAAEDDSVEKESTSKRQEKLRKRSERGDPRVRTLQR